LLILRVPIELVIQRLETATQGGGGPSLISLEMTECRFDQRAAPGAGKSLQSEAGIGIDIVKLLRSALW